MRQKHTGIAILILIFIQQCSGEKEKTIDWTRCTEPNGRSENAETLCYVLARCKTGDAGEVTEMQVMDKPDKMKPSPAVCDTGIQFKPFGRSKWLVYMQVEGSNLGGEVFAEGNNKLFGCKNTATEWNANLKQESYLHAEPVFSEARIFCAFILSPVADEDLTTLLGREGGSVRLAFKYSIKGGQPTEINMKQKGDAIGAAVLDTITCDPDKAIFPGSSDNTETIANQILVTHQDNKCEFGDLYAKGPGDQEHVLIDNLKCEVDSTSTLSPTPYNFVYNKKQESGKKITIPKAIKFSVFCGTKACVSCPTVSASITTDCTDCDEPSKFDAGKPETGECATMKCTEDRWLIETVDKTVMGRDSGALECKKSKSGNMATWFFKDSEVASAKCTKSYDCMSKTKVNFKCPSDQDSSTCKGAEPEKANDMWGCGKAPIMAKEGEGKAWAVGEFTCDPATGDWTAEKGNKIQAGAFVYCDLSKADSNGRVSQGGSGGIPMVFIVVGVIVGVLLTFAIVSSIVCIRRHKKYTASERELRKRPNTHWLVQMFSNQGLPTGDLAALKEWDDVMFEKILANWMKFAIYERYKFTERVAFEMGVSSTVEQFFMLFMRVFEVETDYRIWRDIVPTFKLLHAQAADKDDNKDCDKRMRKLCIAQCRKLLDKFGYEGVNSEFRDTAYQRYVVFNLLYYCEDKTNIDKFLDMFDKQKFNLHSINRQVCWAAAIREKGEFEMCVKAANQAIVDKNVDRLLSERGMKKKPASSTNTTKTDGGSTKSKDDSGKVGSKEKKGGSKEKGPGSKESKSKESKSNNSNRSNKSKKDKKGSKEQASGQGKKGGSLEKGGGSKESKSSNSSKKKGGSKEAGKGKGKSREKAGSEEQTGTGGESGKEKKEPSGKEKKQPSGKDKRSSKDKETPSGKDKKSVESGKDKKDASGKEKKDKSNKSSKENKSGRSSKEKKSTESGKEKKDKSEKGSKALTEKTAADKSGKSAKVSKKSMRSAKTKKIGLKERKDADGDKLHGDRAQHLFFALGSCKSKERVATFLAQYGAENEFDPSNLVYLFQATMEWDDTRPHGIDLFLNMTKEVWKKMPPGHKYHMRILKNFRRYVIGQTDLQKIQDHITNDKNYTDEHYRKMEITLMLKRIHNTVILQPRLIDELDRALKRCDA